MVFFSPRQHPSTFSEGNKGTLRHDKTQTSSFKQLYECQDNSKRKRSYQVNNRRWQTEKIKKKGGRDVSAAANTLCHFDVFFPPAGDLSLCALGPRCDGPLCRFETGGAANALSVMRTFFTLAPRTKHSRDFQNASPSAPVRVHCFTTMFMARSVRITTPLTVSPSASSMETSLPRQLRRISMGVMGRREELIAIVFSPLFCCCCLYECFC